MEAIIEESQFFTESQTPQDFISDILSEIIDQSVDSVRKSDFQKKYELMV